MKKLLILLTFIILTSAPVFAVSGVKVYGKICCDYNCETECDNISFKTLNLLNYSEIYIPEGSQINTQVINLKQEKRFHKSAFVVCKVLNYTKDDCIVDLEDRNLNAIIKGYEKLDKKDATIAGAEFATTTAASFIVPGVDILYYFTKGAIQNNKAENRFKSGVHNAYDNSIFWLFLKGKPLDLKADDDIVVILYHPEKTEE